MVKAVGAPETENTADLLLFQYSENKNFVNYSYDIFTSNRALNT